MAGLLGGKKSAGQQIPIYTSLNMQTSAQGLPIPIVIGTVRASVNLIWYGDFRSTAQRQKAGKGGGNGSITSYNYSTAVAMALCEGTIQGILRIWAGKSLTTLTALNMTYFGGSPDEAPWSYLVGRHPTQALSYADTAYVASSLYQLGSSPDLPQHNFEVKGHLANSDPYAGPDVNPRYVVEEFLTNDHYGVQMPIDSIDVPSLNQFQSYCQAQGLFFSVYLSQQEQAQSTLQRWGQLTNTWITWTGTALKFVPLGTSPLSANGENYYPNNTPVYNLGYDDFVSEKGQPPITVSRSDPADGYNQVQIDCLDRSNAYNNTPVYYEDAASVDEFGKLQSQVINGSEICVPAIAMTVASLIGKRAVYIRNTYSFRLGPQFVLLETGDIVTLTDPNIGLVEFAVRIRKIEEDADLNLQIEAEEFPAGIGGAASYEAPLWEGSTATDVLVDPGMVNEPGIIEPAATATGGVAQVWLGLSGGQWWGGAGVYISFDGGTTYSQIGIVNSASVQGELTADLPISASPDVTNTLAVDTEVSDSTIPATADTSDADALRTLVLVGQELMAYGSAVPGVGPFDFDLTYLVRGAYGTTIADHFTDDLFTRMDPNTIFVYNLPEDYVGSTLYFKFPSFNVFGMAQQGLDDVPAYTYSPTGLAYYIAPPTGVSLAPSRVTQADGTSIITMNLGWTASPGPLLGNYQVQWSTDGGSTWFGDTSYGNDALAATYTPALATTNYMGRVRAVSQSGQATSSWAVSSLVNSGGLVSGVPSTPTGFSASGGPGLVNLSWTLASDPSILDWTVWRDAGPGGTFGSAVAVETTFGSSWTDVSVTPGSTYTYFLTARNAAGNSAPTAGQDATALPLGTGQPYDIPMSFIGVPTSSMVFYRALLVRGITLPAGLTGSQAECEVAPTSNYTITIVRIVAGVPTTLGTIDWLAGSTTGTFSFASSVTLAAADTLELVGQVSADPTFANPSVTLASTR